MSGQSGDRRERLVTRHTHCHATTTNASYLQTIVLLYISAFSAEKKRYLLNILHIQATLFYIDILFELEMKRSSYNDKL